MFDPDFCDYDSKDEFDEAWEQSFLDYDVRVLSGDDDDDDEKTEEKPLTRTCTCCTMRK
jgi:hypothetical protein